jgi:photosynthetic reaction center cytochrome c subunit
VSFAFYLWPFEPPASHQAKAQKMKTANESSEKTAVVRLALAFALGIGVAVSVVSTSALPPITSVGDDQASGAVPKPQMAEEVFKNVQALKGISVDDFVLTMGIMTSALGFDCANCHENAGTDKVNWAADTPMKLMARRMVLMVKAINRDHFGGRATVTCFTCHHTRDRPLATPTMAMVYGPVVVESDDILPNEEGTPPAEQILDKYIAAVGGVGRLAALTSYTATGTSEGFGGFGGRGDVHIYAQAPDKRATIIQFKNAPGRDDNARTFDGTVGWIRTPRSILGEYILTGSELDGARFDAQLGFPGQIKQILKNWRVSTPFAPIEGRDVYAVQGDGPRGTFVTLYFDKQSGLLVRSLRYGQSPIGRIPTQVDYADYREVNAIRFPFRWTFSWLDGRDSLQLTEVTTNVSIDKTRFDKPSTAGR